MGPCLFPPPTVYRPMLRAQDVGEKWLWPCERDRGGGEKDLGVASPHRALQRAAVCWVQRTNLQGQGHQAGHGTWYREHAVSLFALLPRT